MNNEKQVVIDLKGEIGRLTVEDIIIRVRAAMRNGRNTVILQLAPDCIISSAELLSFLAATSTHLSASGGSLRIRGARGQSRELLAIAQLADLLEPETPEGAAP